MKAAFRYVSYLLRIASQIDLARLDIMVLFGIQFSDAPDSSEHEQLWSWYALWRSFRQV